MSPKDPAANESGPSAMMYRQAILDHYKDPVNWGRTEPVDVEHEGDNPLCGDHLTITLALDGETVVDARFEGQGCAISQAATDIFLEEVKGAPVDDVLAMDRETVSGLLGIELSPARVKCAILGLVIVRDALKARREGQELEGPSRTE